MIGLPLTFFLGHEELGRGYDLLVRQLLQLKTQAA
jgi:hypothetical protein